MTVRLAILTTHPIQYHAEWYRALAATPALDIHVYYCHRARPSEQAKAGFGVEFDWDVPLLSGYPCTFLHNVANSPDHGRFSGLDTPEIKSIIRGNYDAIMINGWSYKSAWQAIWACWQLGVKVLVRSDSHLHTPRMLPTRILKPFLYRRFIPRFDGCLAVGKWSREYFLRYGAKSEHLFVVPHAVDNAFFQSQTFGLTPRRAELRRKWNLEPHASVFAFAGKFITRKRPMDFIKAIRGVVQSNPNVQGLMIGDGPLRTVCEEYVRTHQLPVRFSGFLNQSEIATGYVACDALVLPSDGRETWGLVVNEAMACGRPCIVSDQAGCGPDLIVEGQTGAIVPFGNTKLLSQMMSQMAGDPVRLQRMGIEANKKIQEHSVPIAVTRLVECLRVVVGSSVLHADAK
jgi:glycosyltransferase involved in cell wall biosynthesis